jgi:hypothetical protein
MTCSVRGGKLGGISSQIGTEKALAHRSRSVLIHLSLSAGDSVSVSTAPDLWAQNLGEVCVLTLDQDGCRVVALSHGR